MLDHPGKLEVMDAAEEAERRLPARHVIAHDRGDDGVIRERTGERCVELRAAALEVVRHAAEDLGDGLVAQVRS
jgi:hypothetical protein